ncbi:MAG TPA: metal ABC transporter ATP-binding protein [Candidatus Limnocylindrales bacterium]|nr:metal ABC transporter ATP-binding protein [Candidatus Limnocylindrales bacterium]
MPEGVVEYKAQLEPLLSVRDLSVEAGGRSIIRDLTFEVKPGGCLAIIGPNGAGKTLLLNALMGLVAYRGEVLWSHETRLGYVPQRITADRQIPIHFRDLLHAKAKLLNVREDELHAVCDRVGLGPELLDTRIGVLSGGQFQKALIAFALVGRPNVLLFDEPTASLDEITEERIYELLHDLQIERGITLILISHDLSIVYRYADTVLCLSKGHPCMGAPRDVLTPELLEDLYSAPPRYYQHVEEH